jgi:general stress protein 26
MNQITTPSRWFYGLAALIAVIGAVIFGGIAIFFGSLVSAVVFDGTGVEPLGSSTKGGEIMDEKTLNLENEVQSHFKDIQMVFLATADGDQPKVRPVTMLHFNDKFWVGTGTDDAKIKQIKENKKVEFCLFIKEEKASGYIRGQGEAIIVQDKETRKMLAENMPYFKDFWKGSDDPNYTLLEIVIKEIEYLKPGEFKVEKLTL